MTDEQLSELKEAFRCAVALSIASLEDNESTCGSFHISPFKTHWDKQTAEEVKYHVQLYTRTWIVAPMERALGLKMADVNDEMMLSWHRKQTAILENKIKNKQ